MFNWFKRKVVFKAVEMHTREMQQYISVLKGMPNPEMATLVALAAGMRMKFKEMGGDLETIFESPLGDNGQLAEIATGISQLVNVLQADPASSAMAMGAMVWLHSVRAHIHPELRHLAQDMWKELQRGIDGAVEAYIALVKSGPELPQNTMFNTDYVPPFLKPFREAQQ